MSVSSSSALVASRNLTAVQNKIANTTAKLSSGSRITKSSDDAAAFGVANVLRSDIKAYSQAARNAEQAGSVYAIADGAAQSVAKMAERMKELAGQAASDSVDSAGRSRIIQEFTQLQAEITRTVNTVKFQGNALLNGGFGATVNASSTALTSAAAGVYGVAISGAAAGSYTLSSASSVVTMTNGSTSQTLAVTAGANQTLNFSSFGISVKTNTTVGAATLDAKNISVAAGTGTFLVGASGSYSSNDVLTIDGSALDLRTSALGINADSVDTLANAQTALTNLDTAIGKINAALGVIGAGQSRVDTALDNLKTTIQNFSAAESTLRDLDIADEMANFSKMQIMQQAATSVLAQANQAGQGVMKLFQ